MAAILLMFSTMVCRSAENASYLDRVNFAEWNNTSNTKKTTNMNNTTYTKKENTNNTINRKNTTDTKKTKNITNKANSTFTTTFLEICIKFFKKSYRKTTQITINKDEM